MKASGRCGNYSRRRFVLAISSEKLSSALSAVLIAFVGFVPSWKKPACRSCCHSLMGTIIAMAIPTEVGSVRIGAAYFLTRTFICLLGLGAVVWSGFALRRSGNKHPLMGLPQRSFGATPSKCNGSQGRREKLRRLSYRHFVIQPRCIMRLFYV